MEENTTPSPPPAKPKKKKLARAMGAAELAKKKFITYGFKGVWQDMFGDPETNMKVIIWGDSGNGKSDFVVQLAKYLAQFGKVLIDSIEEGHALTMQRTYARHNLQEVNKKVLLLHREPIDELMERLSRRNSADFIILDSIQHSRITKEQYRHLVNRFNKKAFIFISHAKGKEVKGDIADFIRFDCDVKIFVEGYIAFVDANRFGGNKPFTIWQEGAEDYWGVQLPLMLQGRKRKSKNKTISEPKKEEPDANKSRTN